MGLLYHLARAPEWEAAKADGIYRGSKDDRRDGFIHFSTASQVAASAARFRAGETDTLLVAVDEEAAGPWRWEEASSGALFPHLYSTLAVGAAASVHALPLGPDGRHVFPKMLD
jgi:uncharacterized protein (DUF952 family)